MDFVSVLSATFESAVAMLAVLAMERQTESNGQSKGVSEAPVIKHISHSGSVPSACHHPNGSLPAVQNVQDKVYTTQFTCVEIK